MRFGLRAAAQFSHEVGLFHHEVGLFYREVAQFSHEVGLFHHEVGLFYHEVGLFIARSLNLVMRSPLWVCAVCDAWLCIIWKSAPA